MFIQSSESIYWTLSQEWKMQRLKQTAWPRNAWSRQLRSKNNNLIVAAIQVCSRCLKATGHHLWEGRRREWSQERPKKSDSGLGLSFLFPGLTGWASPGAGKWEKKPLVLAAQDAGVQEALGSGRSMEDCSSWAAHGREGTSRGGDKDHEDPKLLEGLDLLISRFQTVVGKA